MLHESLTQPHLFTIHKAAPLKRKMLKKRNILPPLDYLLAFEVAAKNGSFAGAASVLNISESAISRKVRLLESHYNVALFVRGRSSITLTREGARLQKPVSDAIDILRDVSRDTLGRGHSGGLTLAATNSVAALWLMPRLRQFRRSNPRVRINLVSSDDDAECLSDKMDLAILRGDGDWPGFNAKLLFGETVFPVCSPDYLIRRKSGVSTETLHEHDLIEVASTHTEWMDWQTWLASLGAEPAAQNQVVEVNTYPLSVQAAVDGLGIALGWGHLVDSHLQNGELVRPMNDTAVRTSAGYYLLKRDGQKSFPEQIIIEQWLNKVSETRQRYG